MTPQAFRDRAEQAWADRNRPQGTVPQGGALPPQRRGVCPKSNSLRPGSGVVVARPVTAPRGNVRRRAAPVGRRSAAAGCRAGRRPRAARGDGGRARGVGVTHMPWAVEIRSDLPYSLDGAVIFGLREANLKIICRIPNLRWPRAQRTPHSSRRQLPHPHRAGRSRAALVVLPGSLHRSAGALGIYSDMLWHGYRAACVVLGKKPAHYPAWVGWFTDTVRQGLFVSPSTATPPSRRRAGRRSDEC